MLAKIDDFLLGIFSRICAFIRTRNAQKKKNRSQTPLEDVARRFTTATKIISYAITGQILFIQMAAPHPVIFLITLLMLYLHMQRNQFYSITNTVILIANKFPNDPRVATLITMHRLRSLNTLLLYGLSAAFVTLIISISPGTSVLSLKTVPDQWISDLIVLPFISNTTNAIAVYIATFISGSTTTSRNPFAKARASLLPAMS